MSPSPSDTTPTASPTPFEHLLVKAITEKRGVPRLYLEAQYLNTAGFTPGLPLEVGITRGRIAIRPATITPAKRHVGRRTRKTTHREIVIPVIDLTADDIRAAFGIAESVQVRVTDGEIIVTATKLAARRANRCRNGREGSLFSGAGLLSEAARRAGFTPAFGVELDARYADLYMRNHPQARLYNCSVTEVPFAELPQVELLTCGLPCEPYAAARSTDRVTGAKRDRSLPPEAHPAACLLFALPLVLEAVNPATVVIEESDRFEGTAAWYLLRDWLTLLGYHVESRVLNAADHGSLAARKRTVMVATSDGQPVPWPSALPRTQRAASILNAPDDPENEWFDFAAGEKTYVATHWERAAARGHGRIAQMVHDTVPTIKTITKRYAAVRADNPMVVHPDHVPRLATPTTGSRQVRPGTATKFRLLTVTELKRLHGLADTYDLGESKTVACEGLGQGVDTTLFERVIRSVTGRAAADLAAGRALTDHVGPPTWAAAPETRIATVGRAPCAAQAMAAPGPRRASADFQLALL